MSMYRNANASVLTRKAKKALAGRVGSVSVKSSQYLNGTGEVAGKEIEALMSARQILVEAGIYCSNIKTEFKALDPCFYIALSKEQAE